MIMSSVNNAHCNELYWNRRVVLDFWICVCNNRGGTWWLHASENPSSILCVVSGHICTYFYHNPFSGIVYSIMSNKTLPYHTIIVGVGRGWGGAGFRQF